MIQDTYSTINGIALISFGKEKWLISKKKIEPFLVKIGRYQFEWNLKTHTVEVQFIPQDHGEAEIVGLFQC